MKKIALVLCCMMLLSSIVHADEAEQPYEVLITAETWEAIDPSQSGFADSTAFHDYTMSVIAGIATHLNRPDWYKVYGDEVIIEYRMTDGPSHAEGGYRAVNNPIPITNINQRYFEKGMAPVAHETTHIMFPKFSLLSMREGLAGYCHELFGENPTIFSFTVPVHQHVRYLKETQPTLFEETLAAVGNLMEEMPYTEGDYRAVFYTISHSLAKYIIETYGVDAYMTLYESDPYNILFEDVLGQSMETIITEWLAYIDALPTTLSHDEIATALNQ